MKRIDLATLARYGLIKSGDVFCWKRNSGEIIHKVVLTENYVLQSGNEFFQTPTSAAKFFNGDKPVNGWLVWKVLDRKISLENLRKTIVNNELN